MKFTLSWLKEHLDTSASIEEVRFGAEHGAAEVNECYITQVLPSPTGKPLGRPAFNPATCCSNTKHRSDPPKGAAPDTRPALPAPTQLASSEFPLNNLRSTT